MKKLAALVAAATIAVAAFAIPARPGWHLYATTNGNSIALQLQGDEYAHWLEDEQGGIYRLNSEGFAVPDTETRADKLIKRKNAPMFRSNNARRARRDVGTTPNLAPKGIVILANFTDATFQSSNTTAQMDSMMNGLNYSFGGTHASAREYFKAQSKGAYVPDFDVFGPVTVNRNYAYYGQNDADDNDMYPGDLIVEACKKADQLYDINWNDYNNDGDSYVDFVYVIYAGKGEADGGAASTIWPHNWDIQSAIYYGNCTYTSEQTQVDGLYINNYACSGELNGDSGKRNSIGTICHEFGHVLGLPDFYDTDYGTNYDDEKTPNDWDIMDGGSYNGEDSWGNNYAGTCPPNYSAWEKYFFGWVTPVNPGTTGADITLYASEEQDYNVYQINSSGTLKGAVVNGLSYYIENRQQTGWDAYLPGHGMLVWKVNFNATYWSSNEPNLSSHGNPNYTLDDADGDGKIGEAADPYPGTGNKRSWNRLSGKALTNITESQGVITCLFAGGASSTTPTDTTTTPTDTTTVTPTDTTDTHTILEGDEAILEILVSELADANNWVDGTQYATINLSDDIQASCSGGANTGKYYVNGEQWRLYQSENASMTITNTNGLNLVSVAISYASQKNGILLTPSGNTLSSGDTYTVNDDAVTFTVSKTGSGTNGQARVTGFTVRYKIPSSVTDVQPTLQPSAPVKRLLNGQLVIEANGIIYSIHGVKINAAH